MNSGTLIFPNELWRHGPSPGQFYNFPGNGFNTMAPHTAPATNGNQRPGQMITTGSSVVGIKFEGGVMIAADNLVSYGSLARFQDVPRVYKVNEKIIIGVGGDHADFQSIKRNIDQKMIDDVCHGDNIEMKPQEMYNYLTRVMYNRRSRINPLYLDMVVGGLDNGVPFLGHVDLRGRSYSDDVVATGFGKHLALPLIREQLTKHEKLTQALASEVLRKCMEVLFYRDCRAMNKYTVAVCTKEGTVVEGPYSVKENWQVATYVKGF